MTLVTQDIKKLIRQKIVVGFVGTKPSDPWVQSLCQRIIADELGGVIFFGRNFPAELSKFEHHELINALKPSGSRCFLAIDQEGGKVQRLSSRNGHLDFLSPMCLTSLPRDDARREVGKLATNLAALGLNWNFAPSVDVDYQPTCPIIGAVERSFSQDPEVVCEMARLYIEEQRKAGVLPCVKHFPGHGSAQGDTHDLGVDITRTWNEKELRPYRELNRTGHIDAVMTGHLIHTAIDELPASLSKRWITKLREEIGYKGVIITDDLHMGGILNRFRVEEATRLALHSGADLLMFSNNPLAAKGVKDFTPDPEISEKVARIIEEEILAGRYTAAQLEESAARIAKVKARLRA
jgi:beta-N-acetylhexosaminidase